MGAELVVEVKPQPGYTLAVVVGELDIATTATLREQITELLVSRRPLIVDLDRVSFIDAGGLGVLVGATKRAHAAGVYLRLVCTQPRIRRLLQITGLDRQLPLAATVDQARTTLPPQHSPHPPVAHPPHRHDATSCQSGQIAEGQLSR